MSDPADESSTIWWTAAIWIVFHVLILVMLGWDWYFHVVGAQLVYGVLAGMVIASAWKRPVGLGIMVGAALATLVLTILCFGGGLLIFGV